MNRDELNRDKVVEWLSNETTLLEVECEAAGDGLMSLIAPVIEAAERWEKLKQLLRIACDGCPIEPLINSNTFKEPPMEIDEKELAELRKKAEEADRLRQFLWISHGCPVSALYGDDGEMQCHACRLDFKRMPIEKVFEMLRELMKKAGLWEEVEKIAKRNWMDDPCEGCQVEERCDVSNSLCGQAYSVVDALKEPT